MHLFIMLPSVLEHVQVFMIHLEIYVYIYSVYIIVLYIYTYTCNRYSLHPTIQWTAGRAGLDRFATLQRRLATATWRTASALRR
jgi:hypothetical protein